MAKSIAKLSVSLTASTGKFTKGMERSTRSTEKFVANLRRTTAAVGAFTAAIAAAGIATLAYQVRKAAGSIDSLAKASDKLGIATEKLQSLRMAAELTGVSANTLDMAIQRMVRRISEAAQGSGEAVKALEELGLSAEYLNSLSPDEQFKAIAQAMKGVATQGDRVRLAMRLFDSEGVALVNTLALGAEGLNEVESRMRSMGLTISRLDASQVEKMNDAMLWMSKLMEAVWMRITVDLAPALTVLTDRFARFAEQQDGVANSSKAVIKGFIAIRAFAVDMGRGFEALAVTAGLAFTSIGHVVTWLFETVAIAANELAQFSGIGEQAAAAFLEKATAAREATENLIIDSADYLNALSQEESAVLGIADAWRQVDRDMDKARSASESVRREFEATGQQVKKSTDGMSELDRFAEQVINQTMTPIERFNKQIERLNEALENNKISLEVYERAVKQAEEARDAALGVGVEEETRTAQFRQIRLSQVALNGVRSPEARPQEIKSDQLDQLIIIGRELVRDGAFARVAV